MTPKDIRNMVSLVRAIRAGKWTNELPAWSRKACGGLNFGLLQETAQDTSEWIRAVQTAEAFILLAHASDMPFDETRFLQDCGFVPK